MGINNSFGTCARCAKRIIWVRTSAGKNMPCNPEILTYREVIGGREKIVTPDGKVVSAEIVQADSPDAVGVGYISHFATCQRTRR